MTWKRLIEPRFVASIIIAIPFIIVGLILIRWADVKTLEGLKLIVGCSLFSAALQVLGKKWKETSKTLVDEGGFIMHCPRCGRAHHLKLTMRKVKCVCDFILME